MIHIPLIDTQNESRMIEFTHYSQPAAAGTWKKENIISRSNLKINIFVSGEFSVFADEKSHRPIYGDIAIFPPYKLHCGQILKDTFTDYYQLDVGMLALDMVPGGMGLLEQLARFGANGSFLRPEENAIREMMQLCNQLQEQVRLRNMPMAFAKTVELLSLLCRLYQEGGKRAEFCLSLHTQRTLKYIESHYSESITIATLSGTTGVSTSYLSRIFRQETGMGIHEYVNQYRITKAAVMLRSQSISDVAYQCGFSDCSHFISVFKKQFGCTPKAYQKRLQADYAGDIFS